MAAGRSGCASMMTVTLVGLALLIALGAVIVIWVVDQLDLI